MSAFHTEKNSKHQSALQTRKNTTHNTRARSTGKKIRNQSTFHRQKNTTHIFLFSYFGFFQHAYNMNSTQRENILHDIPKYHNAFHTQKHITQNSTIPERFTQLEIYNTIPEKFPYP